MPRRALRALPVTIAGAIVLAAVLLPGVAVAARLVGGREQAAVLRVFAHSHGRRPELATSVRAASGAPAWVVVRWVVAATGTERRPPSPVLHSSYFHIAGGRIVAATPPSTARSDLAAPFSVSVVYTGSGSEAITYSQSTSSVCVGGGAYVNSETETVQPMSWTVRYLVDLDRLQAAVTDGRAGALLPTVSFVRGGSTLSATEQLSRSSVDQGCFGPTKKIRCTTSYSLKAAGAAAALGLGPAGLQVGIPMAARAQGDCAPDDYPLGPSLWDSGATTAAVGPLSLTGGRLPPNPYAPVAVAWPLNSAGAAQGYLSSPCQGNTTQCTDTMRWTGTVRLVASGA